MSETSLPEGGISPNVFLFLSFSFLPDTACPYSWHVSLVLCQRGSGNNPKIQRKSYKSAILSGALSNTPRASDVAVYQPQASKRPWDTGTSALQKPDGAHSSAASRGDAMGPAQPPQVGKALLYAFSSAYGVLPKGKLVSQFLPLGFFSVRVCLQERGRYFCFTSLKRQ